MSLLEEAVNDAEFIFEAIIEDMEVKQDMFESEKQTCQLSACVWGEYETLYDCQSSCVVVLIG